MEETVDADRILLMDAGKLVLDGSPREVFSDVARLKSYRMDVPLITELSDKLKAAGSPIEKTVLRKEELEEELLRLFHEGFCLERGGKALEHEEESVESKAFSATGEIKKEEELDNIVEVKNLTAIFQEGTAMESTALKDVSLHIRRGSLTALIGHTGSGKSTLLQHLNGLMKASRGEIWVSFRENPPLLIKEKGFLFRKGKIKKVQKRLQEPY